MVGGFQGDVRRAATVLTVEDNATKTLRQVKAETKIASANMVQAAIDARFMGGAFAATAVPAAILGATIAGVAATQAKTNDAFRQTQAVLGATGEQMQQLKDTALTLSDQLSVSVDTVQTSMQQLALAGYNVQESMEAVSEVSEIVSAANIKSAKAAKQVSQVLESYSIAAGKAEQVTGAFAATIEETSTTISNLTNALNSTSAAAERTGVSFQEVAAAAGVLADAGVQGREAGQALSNLFTRLRDPSAEVASSLRAAGVEISKLTDENGDLRNLATIISELQGSLAGTETQAQRTRKAVELYGKEGAKAVLALIERQKGYNKQIGEVFRSEVKESIAALSDLSDQEITNLNKLGTLELKSNIKASEIASQLKQLSEAGQSTAQIASSLQTQLDLSQRTATALAESATDASTSVEELASSIGGAADASKLARMQTDTLMGSIENLIGTLDSFAFALFRGMRGPLMGFVNSLDRMFSGLQENEEAMKALGRAAVPLFGILAGMSVVLGGIFLKATIGSTVMQLLGASMLGTASGGVTLMSVLNGLITAFSKIFTWFAVAAVAVMSVWEAFKRLSGFIESDYLGVGQSAANVTQALGDVMGFVMPFLTAFIEGFMVLAEIIGGAVAVVLIPVIHLLSLLVDLFSAILGPIGNFIASNKALVDTVGFVAATLATYISAVLAFGGTVVEVFGGIMFVVSMLTKAAMILGGALAGITAPAWSTVAAILAVVAAIGALIAYIFNLGGARSMVNGFIDDIITGFWNLVDQAKAILMQMPVFAKLAGGNVIGALVAGLKSAFPVLSFIMEQAAALISSYLPFSNADQGPLSNIMSVGGNIISSIVSGLTGSTDLRAAMETVLGGVTTAIGIYIDIWQGLVLGFVNTFIMGINKIIDTLNKIPTVNLPNVPTVNPGGGDDGGGSGSDTDSGGSSGGITVDINQELIFDGNENPEEVRQAAEEGAEQASNDLIAELDRLLQQEMGS